MEQSNEPPRVLSKSAMVQIPVITAPKARESFLNRPMDVIPTLLLILSLPVSLPIALAIISKIGAFLLSELTPKVPG